MFVVSLFGSGARHTHINTQITEQSGARKRKIHINLLNILTCLRLLVAAFFYRLWMLFLLCLFFCVLSSYFIRVCCKPGQFIRYSISVRTRINDTHSTMLILYIINCWFPTTQLGVLSFSYSFTEVKFARIFN